MVVTIPAKNSSRVEELTIEACRRAGISGSVLTIPEPIAALMTFENHMMPNENILVFHLGGCTLEVSILEHKHGHWRIKACKYIPFIGGCKVDDLLVNDCMVGI